MEQLHENLSANITRSTPIGEIVKKYPATIEVLAKYGVHCAGCSANLWETVEEGFKGHGMSDEEIDAALEELNAAIIRPAKALGSLTVTEAAIAKIKDLQSKYKKQGQALRLSVIPGGCSGMSYAFEFTKETSKADHVIEEAGVKIAVDKDSMAILEGASVDYVDSLQGAGFRIVNPNAKRSCACGQSFGG